MSHVNDCKFKALGRLGFTGSINDREILWLKSLGATTNNINDAWSQITDINTHKVFWDSPLITNGIDTITGAEFSNQNPNQRQIQLTTGFLTVPPFTVATYPNHLVSGTDQGQPVFRSIGGNSVDIGDITSCPTDSINNVWPSSNVTFEFNFTMLSNDNNTFMHIESSDQTFDTFIARTGNSLEFNHGNDQLIVPYANLLEVGREYKASATITPTKLIGKVEGTPIDVETIRTDTRDIGFAPLCYIGGFQETDAPMIAAYFRVKQYDPENTANSDKPADINAAKVNYFRFMGASGNSLNDLTKDFWCRVMAASSGPVPLRLTANDGTILTDNNGTELLA